MVFEFCIPAELGVQLTTAQQAKHRVWDGTRIVTSLALFGTSACKRKTGSVALSVSTGYALCMVGATHHAVAWIAVQEALAAVVEI